MKTASPQPFDFAQGPRTLRKARRTRRRKKEACKGAKAKRKNAREIR
jgi:hypothetical protein